MSEATRMSTHRPHDAPFRIVLATANRDKITEMRHALRDLPLEVLTRDDFPGIPEVVEDRETLEENAIKKARALCDATSLPAIADDTGLEVDALGGAPGVYSSRYGGPGATYADNVRILLENMRRVPRDRRRARFRCVIALAEPPAVDVFVEGVCEGEIAEEPRGDGGFGYDPVFLVAGEGRTFAEMTVAEKDRISHRGIAMARMRKLLEERFLL
jgi:XTP/dITP diphosphohydrolase